MPFGFGMGLGLGAAYLPPSPQKVLGSSLLEWWEADAGNAVVASGNWTGINGNVMSEASTRPGVSAANTAFAAGGVASINFTAGNHKLDCTTISSPVPGTSARWRYLILRQTSWVSGGRLCGAGGGVFNASLIYANPSTPALRSYNGANGAVNTAATIGTPVRVIQYLSNNASDYLIVGADAGTNGNAGNTNSGTSWGLGDRGDGSGATLFEVTTAIVCNAAPSVAQLAAVDAFFTRKYPLVSF